MISLYRIEELSKYPSTEQPYLCTAGALTRFLQDLIGGAIGGYSLSSLFQDNSSYITRALFIPFDLTKMYNTSQMGTGTFIRIGKKEDLDASTYSYDAQHRVYSTNGIKLTLNNFKWFTVNVSRRFNNYLDFNPYTKIFLQIPYFGLIEINPIDAYKGTITVYLMVDIRTGNATIYINNKDDVTIEQKTVKAGMDISIGKTNAEDISRNNILHAISLISDIGITVAGGVSGNPIVAGTGISLLTKNVTETINNNVSKLTSITGGGESRDKHVQDGEIYLITETVQDVSYPDSSLKGKPTKDNKDLGELTGYTEIGKINFNPNGEDIYDDEINEIVDLLRSCVIL